MATVGGVIVIMLAVGFYFTPCDYFERVAYETFRRDPVYSSRIGLDGLRLDRRAYLGDRRDTSRGHWRTAFADSRRTATRET
jgi:hypothetical protein